MKGLENYETVKERKKRFYADNEDGRIIVEQQSDNILEYALFKVSIYKDKADQEKGLAWSTGYALEMRDKEKSISTSGKEYESVNYTSWTENCEESAVGRALDNAGYSGNNKCSREEMEKAQRHAGMNSNKPVNNTKQAGQPQQQQGERLPDFETIKQELASMGQEEQGVYRDRLIGLCVSDKQKSAMLKVCFGEK